MFLRRDPAECDQKSSELRGENENLRSHLVFSANLHQNQLAKYFYLDFTAKETTRLGKLNNLPHAQWRVSGKVWIGSRVRLESPGTSYSGSLVGAGARRQGRHLLSPVPPLSHGGA